MRYDWLDEYLLGKRGVTKDLQKDWNWVRYHIGGKMFAAVCLDGKNEPYYINVKLEPMEGEFLRSQYEDIIPGYYSNKQHWNSVKPDGQVPDGLMKEMLDKSYLLVLRGLSKHKQRTAVGISCCGTDCASCGLYGTTCRGCNECNGKVFHAPEGKACPIYACAVQRKRHATCADCGQHPCGIWRATRDPQLSDEGFEKTITERVEMLAKVSPKR